MGEGITHRSYTNERSGDGPRPTPGRHGLPETDSVNPRGYVPAQASLPYLPYLPCLQWTETESQTGTQAQAQGNGTQTGTRERNGTEAKANRKGSSAEPSLKLFSLSFGNVRKIVYARTRTYTLNYPENTFRQLCYINLHYRTFFLPVYQLLTP